MQNKLINNRGTFQWKKVDKQPLFFESKNCKTFLSFKVHALQGSYGILMAIKKGIFYCFRVRRYELVYLQMLAHLLRQILHLTMNFATLGPSELRPPFTGASVVSFFCSRQKNLLPSPSGTGQASAPIYCLTTLRRPVFLVNSRLGLVTATSC